MKTIISYAQNREDILLSGFFDDVEKGFYVDLGAFDPEEHSVTKYFYDKGWRGINVEPNPEAYRRLVKYRPEDINFNVGVSDSSGELTMRVYDKGQGLSTFSHELQKQYELEKNGTTSTYKELPVPVVTLKELFERNKVSKIHFMKVDIEGYEYQALSSNDWATYRPEIICVEANHIVKDWRNILLDNGYIKIFFDGLNEYYVSEESKERANKFSYEKTIIGQSVISVDVARQIADIEGKITTFRYREKNLRKQNKELEQTNAFLHSHIHHQLRSKNLIKNLISNIDQIILRNINKITNKPYYYPPLSISKEMDEKALLNAMRGADKEAFNGQPGLGMKIKAKFGDAILFSYVRTRRFIRIIGGFILRRVVKPLKAKLG